MTGVSRSRLETQLIKALGSDDQRIPEAGRLVWGWFCDISETRTIGIAANPISYLEIEAYARLNGIPIRPDHVRLLRAIDRAMMKRWRRETPSEAPNGVEKLPHVSKQVMTPQLFDVMFS